MSYSDEDDFDDLDELLDDFQDEILSKPPGATLNKTNSTSETSKESATSSPTKNDPKKAKVTQVEDINEEELLQNLLNQMSTGDPELSANLNSFLKDLTGGTPAKDSTEKSASTGTNNGNNFQNLISDTVNRIKSSGEQVDQNLKSETQDDELLSTLLKSLDLDLGSEAGLGAGGNGEDLGKLLVEMLDKLSSKEVLYEPLNDLYLKYPSWLSNNKSDPDYEKYNKQYNVIKLIIDKFNDASFNESNPEDKDFVSAKLEELQELGMPPKEIGNDDLSFLNLKDGKGEMEFGDDDIPEEISKEIEDTCKQT